MKFSEKHIQQIQEHGLSIGIVEQQLKTFQDGIPKVNLVAPATLDHGIVQFNEAQKEELIAYYNSHYDTLNIVKFVPASGAATRMFKSLYQFLEGYNVKTESVNAYINKTKDEQLKLFFVGLEKFPFYGEILKKVDETCPNFKSKTSDEKRYCIVKCLLSEQGLNYGNLPKGLVPFHQYKDHNATAFEEHLFEASKYAAPKGEAQLHFTISKAHYNKFKSEYDRIKDIVSKKTDTNFITTESYQKASTDTIAVHLDNSPVIDQNGKLVFRPGGHGALIDNLNALDADVIFIKNIDNVVTFELEDDVAAYKKLLSGLLLQLRNKVFEYIETLQVEKTLGDTQIESIKIFLKDSLNVVFSTDFEKFSKKNKVDFLFNQLNRPLRVCGMVKNEGEPGGGPFWVKQDNGRVSLQIVESVQIDKESESQNNIVEKSTHFNPVDIVCSVKDYQGNTFNLQDFVDNKAGFINTKTVDGQPIKALELPGLWNGGMAFWNTVFVEVPLKTFNPVKTINDLLKAPHQIEK